MRAGVKKKLKWPVMLSIIHQETYPICCVRQGGRIFVTLPVIVLCMHGMERLTIDTCMRRKTIRVFFVFSGAVPLSGLTSTRPIIAENVMCLGMRRMLSSAIS